MTHHARTVHAALSPCVLLALCAVILLLSPHATPALSAPAMGSLQRPVSRAVLTASPMTSVVDVDAATSGNLPATRWGGRGAEHCALSIGIFLGGALGFWVNPFLGTQAMRLGLMASVLNCS